MRLRSLKPRSRAKPKATQSYLSKYRKGKVLLGGSEPAAAWFTTFSQSLGSNNAGWNGFNLRTVIPASMLTTSGFKVRMTMEPSSITEGAQIDSMYIGHAAGAGDAYDFDGTQVPVTYLGNTSWLIGPGGTYLTDEITYDFNEAKAFIVAMHFNSAANDIIRVNALVGANYYHRLAASEVSVSNVGGYTLVPNAVAFINKIEVYQYI